MDNIVSIGRTKKPHGLKGELKFFVEEHFVDDLMEAEILIIDVKGKKTPFFIEDVRVGNNIIVKLEEVDTPETATTLSAKEVFLREKDLKYAAQNKEDAQLPYADCIGFIIFDDTTEVGIVTNLIEYPQQYMAAVNYRNREILIPLNPAFIKKIDIKNKKILMELPEGLLEL